MNQIIGYILYVITLFVASFVILAVIHEFAAHRGYIMTIDGTRYQLIEIEE